MVSELFRLRMLSSRGTDWSNGPNESVDDMSQNETVIHDITRSRIGIENIYSVFVEYAMMVVSCEHSCVVGIS